MNINKVVVIGSGTMGSGIAAHLCNANIPVVLLDLKTEIAEKAKERILKSRKRGIAQPGSASGLGPEGRRFKSCCPDQIL